MAILNAQVQNGLALLRPPGHHALNHAGNGFCLLNNVAIAAKYAIKSQKAQKVLIVDLDVHHGQSTQYNFYDDPNVLYFSVHRFVPILPPNQYNDSTSLFQPYHLCVHLTVDVKV